ncbi:hypothetical protein LPJ78_000131 [Coemansia sp. RSA 989]|nr:hypothetical protein LPJ78_000131 [Coemansia sp. RSA 989]KAJ1876233.1 hypothetical protein LPJ55_000135 [Coemansia sp. RSA 990]KAJ2675787.1 hypothetical protein IWW42_000832 [Coemansia sp. RSA 1085]
MCRLIGLMSSLIVALALLCILGIADAENTCGPSSRYVVAYYPTWKRQSLMNIDWSKISHLNVAFGIPTDSGEFTFDGEWFLPQLVKEAHKENTKVSISIGGWTGSNRMSTIMRDMHKRAALIRSIGAFIDKYELDGVDVDWEYVGRQASKCNRVVPAEDAANFMRFLRALRASLHARFSDSEKLISLAVPVEPFHNQDGPLKDVSPYAEYVDFASIMAFDVNGPWGNSTGPNAPLEYQRNRGAPFSLSQAVNQWLDAKWPAEKLVAGVSFHGHSMTTRNILAAKDGAEMYTPIDKDVPQGDPEDALWYDVCENTNAMSGVWQYRHLRDQGLLKTANSTGEEWIRVWDHQSSTPWLYNPQMRRFISYDDPESVERKVEFVKSKNLKGMMVWSLHSDYNHELLNAVNRIGSLCRGPKSNSDEPQSTHEAQSSSSLSSSSWSPTAPFATLSTASHITPSSTSGVEYSSSSSSEESLSTTQSPETSSSEASVSEPESPSTSSESSASTASGKSILFDSMGAPYMMINGQSTQVPSDLAEKLMQVAEPTSSSSASDMTATTPETASPDTLLPTAPLAIPVVDNLAKSHSPNRPSATALASLTSRTGLSVPTNLFNTPQIPKLTDTQDALSEPTGLLGSLTKQDQSSSGFAATFFLPLDTNSAQDSVSKQATTVIPFWQMMSSAKAASEHASDTSAASANSASSTSDPLATTATSSSST